MIILVQFLHTIFSLLSSRRGTLMSSPFSLLSFCSLDESATFSLFCSYAAIHGRLCDVDAVVSVVHRANIKSNKKTRKTAIKTHDICSRSCGAAISALVFFISSTLSLALSLPTSQASTTTSETENEKLIWRHSEPKKNSITPQKRRRNSLSFPPIL